MPKYWYKFYEYECPVCGGGQSFSYKERAYGQKPKRWEKRHILVQDYDYCLEYGSLTFSAK